MDFEIPGTSIRLFGTTISYLAKLGSDCFLELREDRLIFRVLNSNNTAYAGISFLRPFFSRIRVSLDFGAQPTPAGPVGKCRIKLPALAAVFRPPALSSVERCVCDLGVKPSSFVVDMYCYRGVRKHYEISLVDSDAEALEARARTDAPVVVVAPPKLLSSCLDHFPSTTYDELTIRLGRPDPATSPSVVFRCHPLLQRQTELPRGALFTDLMIDSSEFTQYTVPSAQMVPTEDPEAFSVAVCFRDFRTIVGLCEYVQQPITLCLCGQHDPMLVAVNTHMFEAKFVIGTMVDSTAAIKPKTDSQKETQRISGSQIEAGRAKERSQLSGRDMPPSRGSLAMNDDREVLPGRKRPHDSGTMDEGGYPEEKPSDGYAKVSVHAPPSRLSKKEEDQLRDMPTMSGNLDQFADAVLGDEPPVLQQDNQPHPLIPGPSDPTQQISLPSDTRKALHSLISLPSRPSGRLFLGDSELQTEDKRERQPSSLLRKAQLPHSLDTTAMEEDSVPSTAPIK